MKKYQNRYDYMSEKTVDWLKDFANKQGEKLLKDTNVNPDELKNAGRIENILDIVNRQKKVSVDEKVQKYRQLVGLDLIDSIEKEGGKEIIASKIPLSIRDKFANDELDHNDIIQKIKQYVSQVITNRNGSIATPAIIEQIEKYIRVDKDWLRKHYDEIEQIIDNAKKGFTPKVYNELKVNDLARTDDPSKGDKEQPLFLPQTSSSTK